VHSNRTLQIYVDEAGKIGEPVLVGAAVACPYPPMVGLPLERSDPERTARLLGWIGAQPATCYVKRTQEFAAKYAAKVRKLSRLAAVTNELTGENKEYVREDGSGLNEQNWGWANVLLMVIGGVFVRAMLYGAMPARIEVFVDQQSIHKSERKLFEDRLARFPSTAARATAGYGLIDPPEVTLEWWRRKKPAGFGGSAGTMFLADSLASNTHAELLGKLPPKRGMTNALRKHDFKGIEPLDMTTQLAASIDEEAIRKWERRLQRESSRKESGAAENSEPAL